MTERPDPVRHLEDVRNALAHAGKGQRQMVLAMINTVFAQDGQEAAIKQWRTVADQLREKFPKLATLASLAYPPDRRARCALQSNRFVS